MLTSDVEIIKVPQPRCVLNIQDNLNRLTGQYVNIEDIVNYLVAKYPEHGEITNGYIDAVTNNIVFNDVFFEDMRAYEHTPGGERCADAVYTAVQVFFNILSQYIGSEVIYMGLKNNDMLFRKTVLKTLPD